MDKIYYNISLESNTNSSLRELIGDDKLKTMKSKIVPICNCIRGFVEKKIAIKHVQLLPYKTKKNLGKFREKVTYEIPQEHFITDVVGDDQCKYCGYYVKYIPIHKLNKKGA